MLERVVRGALTTRGLVAVVALAMLTAASTVGFAQEDDDSFWPRQIDAEGGRVIVYQPQVENYTSDRLEARAAVSVTIKGESAPTFGAMWFDCRLATDLENRVAYLEQLTVTAAKFPDMEQDRIDQLSRFLEQEAPNWDLTLSVDELLAGLDAAGEAAGESTGLNNDPPEIIFTTQPSVLVMIDGDPKLADIEGYDAEYVVNTPYFIVKNKKDNTFYLKGGELWFRSRDLTGSWEVASQLPAEMQPIAQKIEEEEQQQKQEAAEQAASAGGTEEAEDTGAAEDEPDEGEQPIPVIVVRTEPAELIQTDGEPDYASIAGTQLLYLKNSESDVIMDIASQQYFVLLSGRWYSAKSMTDNNWQYVANDELPADFAAIPADSDLSSVLASVSGTQEARDAVLTNTVPQTAEVDRKSATCEVQYDGSPKFESCSEGVKYATNCDKDVLLIDKTYYCCDNAVWFVSDRPDDGWQVATELPGVIQELPPECPVYNVKYVYIYESTPEVVYVGYTPGYTGSYVYGGCVVYGTGYYYHPWYYTYYYPRPVTWGFGVHYNPWTGWGFHVGVSYGWLHLGVGWCRPWYGGWWGRGGYRWGYRHGYRRGYHHGYRAGYRAGARTGYRAGQHSSNVYRKRDTGVVRTADAGRRPSTGQQPAGDRSPDRGTKDASRQRDTQDRTRDTTTSQKANQPNNVYADKNGDVYRKDGDSWEKRDKDGWSKDDRSSQQSRDQSRDQAGDRSSQQSRQQLDRDQQSRDRSAQRNRDYNNNSSGRSGSANRSGGGGRSRGGGGRRR